MDGPQKISFPGVLLRVVLCQGSPRDSVPISTTEPLCCYSLACLMVLFCDVQSAVHLLSWTA